MKKKNRTALDSGIMFLGSGSESGASCEAKERKESLSNAKEEGSQDDESSDKGWSQSTLDAFKERNRDMFKSASTWIGIGGFVLALGGLVFNWGARVQRSVTIEQVQKIVKREAPTKEELALVRSDMRIIKFQLLQITENQKRFEKMAKEQRRRGREALKSILENLKQIKKPDRRKRRR